MTPCKGTGGTRQKQSKVTVTAPRVIQKPGKETTKSKYIQYTPHLKRIRKLVIKTGISQCKNNRDETIMICGDLEPQSLNYETPYGRSS